ncbi:MAG: hypothetical protein IJC43_06430 [Clostridia bacterium]|nr:hypothetical protein [Clostridia bacterium]
MTVVLRPDSTDFAALSGLLSLMPEAIPVAMTLPSDPAGSGRLREVLSLTQVICPMP